MKYLKFAFLALMAAAMFSCTKSSSGEKPEEPEKEPEKIVYSTMIGSLKDYGGKGEAYDFYKNLMGKYEDIFKKTPFMNPSEFVVPANKTRAEFIKEKDAEAVAAGQKAEKYIEENMKKLQAELDACTYNDDDAYFKYTYNFDTTNPDDQKIYQSKTYEAKRGKKK